MKTYDEILNTMKSSYSDTAGFVPSDSSDLGVRLRVLAGELFNLQNAILSVGKQSNPMTATGEKLDLHAELKGISRLKGSKATGTLTFGRGSALNYPLPIPKGTVCTTQDGLLEYVTTEEGTLPEGETQVIINAESSEIGQKYNCAQGTVCTMKTPPAGIETVSGSAFTGGTDIEGDDSLRARLKSAYTNISNGANDGFYRSIALSTDGVKYAQTATASGEIKLYACDENGTLSESQRSEIDSNVQSRKPIFHTVEVLPARTLNARAGVKVTPMEGYSFDDIKQKCIDAITAYISGLGLGESYYTADLSPVLYGTGLVRKYTFSGLNRDVEALPGDKVVCQSVTVSEEV